MNKIKLAVAYLPLSLIGVSTFAILLNNSLGWSGLVIPYAIIGYFMSFIAGVAALMVLKGRLRKIPEITLIILSTIFIILFLVVNVVMSHWEF